MNKFRPYGIRVANTKTKERVIIELEFGGAEQLYQYLAPIVHDWAMGKEIEPLKCTPNQSDSASLQDVLNSIDGRLNYIERQLAIADITIIEDE